MKLRVKSEFLAVPVVAALICGIHFGWNEYASVQFFIFLASLALVAKAFLGRLVTVSVFGAAFALIIFLSWAFAGHDAHMVLKGFRTAAVILLLYAWQSHFLGAGRRFRDHVYSGIVVASTFSLALATLQFLDSHATNLGIFDIPKSMFALDYGTLFSDRRLELSSQGYFVRASATFSEPSALATVALLAIWASYIRKDPYLRAVGLAIVLISQSLAGLIFAAFLVASNMRTKVRWPMLIGTMLVGTLSLVWLVPLLFGARIDAVSSGADVSLNIRLLEPLAGISRIFGEQLYFGASPDFIMEGAPAMVFTLFDNWLLAQFLFYGILGLFWIAAPYFLLSRTMWPLLAAFMVMNGDAFYYDRYFLLLLAAVMVHEVRQRRNAYDSHDHV